MQREVPGISGARVPLNWVYFLVPLPKVLNYCVLNNLLYVRLTFDIVCKEDKKCPLPRGFVLSLNYGPEDNFRTQELM